jgi:deoxyribodipyrimidine photo-lyase
MRSLLWFKQDLRLDDNLALISASKGHCLLPVYVLDPRQFEVGPLGARRLGVHRARFLLESLSALDSALRQLGSRLLVVLGEAEQQIPRLVLQCGLDQVFSSDEIAAEECAELARVRHQLGNVPLRLTPGGGLYQAGELPCAPRELPRVYSGCRGLFEQAAPAPQPLSIPAQLPPLPPFSQSQFDAIPSLSLLGLGEPMPAASSAMPFAGGETAGQARLRDYLWTGLGLRHYLEPGEEGITRPHASKLSPWLANGSLSSRRVMAELHRHEAQHGRSNASGAFADALLWREFFRWTLQRHGSDLFRGAGTAATRLAPDSVDERFLQWCAGRTGMPLVDAIMRELAATGFISARARQISASYLIGELHQGWRHGAAWFEEHLIDYEVASNWGNWAYLAGLCSDPQKRLGFNTLRLARQYDPQALYISQWLPELQQLPPALRHTPFVLPPAQRALLNYPLLRSIPEGWQPYLSASAA